MPERIPDIVFGFEFQKDRLKDVGGVGVEFLAFPLTWHIAYTTASCYRTSHENRMNFHPDSATRVTPLYTYCYYYH